MKSRLRHGIGTAFAVLAFFLGVSGSARADSPSKLECVHANEDAQVLRRAGKLIEAGERLRVCAADACPGAVRDDCKERLAEVERATPTVVFEWTDSRGADVSAVGVTIDGRTLASVLPHTPVSLDPGEHTCRVEAAGLAPIEKKIVLRDGEKEQRVRVVFAEPPSSTMAPPSAARVAEASPDAPSLPSDGSAQRRIGVVVGGVGVASIVAGSIFGLMVKSTYDDALAHCPRGPHSCDKAGIDEGERAHTQALVSTIGFAAGGALLAGAVVLFVTAPSGARVKVEPVAGASTAGLRVWGAW